MEELESGVNKKFDQFYEDVHKEAVQIFEDLDYQPQDMVELYKNTMDVFKAKKYKFIHNMPQKEEESKKLEKEIGEKFVKARVECQEKLQETQRLHTEHVNYLEQAKNKFPAEKDKIHQEFEQKYTESKKTTEEAAQKAIDAEADAQRKEKLRQTLKTDLTSIRNEIERERDEAVEALKAKFEEEKKAETEKMKAKVDGLLTHIVHYNKAMSSIVYHNEVETKKFDEIMSEIDPSKNKKNAKLVKMIIERVEEEKEGVKMEIGQKIVNEHKAFDSHQKKKRSLMTGAQDIKYVLEHIKKLDESKFISINEKEKDSIFSLFEKYQEEYKIQKDAFIKQDAPKGEEYSFLVKNALIIATEIKNDESRDWIAEKVSLIARISALWACMKAEKNEDDEY